jgi:hypothetical protein
MNAYMDLTKEAQAVKALRESIAALDGEDELLLLDTIEGETGLFEAVDALLGRIRDCNITIIGINQVTEDLDERRRRVEKSAAATRALIEQAMMIAELDKIERPTATLSLSKRAPKLEITTEAEIPSKYWKAADPTLDKKALTADLKAGEAVPGAMLSNGAPSLTIRVK